MSKVHHEKGCSDWTNCYFKSIKSSLFFAGKLVLLLGMQLNQQISNHTHQKEKSHKKLRCLHNIENSCFYCVQNHIPGNIIMFSGRQVWDSGWQRNQHLCPTKGFCFFVFVFFFCLFRAASTVYLSSQARGQIRALAASLPHSHSNVRSEPRLRPTPQFTAMLDP